MSTPCTDAATVRLSEVACSRLESRGADMCMLSTVASQALEAASNADCLIGELASIVERDTRLTSDVLSLANSAAYAPSSPILSLHQAVSRLGLQATKNLILTSSVAAMMRRTSLEREWVREQLWRHAFTTGLLAMRLNRSLRCGFQGEEFTAGLLHDIGRTLYAALLPEHFESIDSMTFDESAATIDEERNVAGWSHSDFGAWYLRRVKLPAPLVTAVEFHHTPEDASEHQRLVALIAAADHMANHLQRFESSIDYQADENPGVRLLRQCGVNGALILFQSSYQEMMDTVSEDAVNLAAL